MVGGAGLPGQARGARLRPRRLRRRSSARPGRRLHGHVRGPGGRRRPVPPRRLRLRADHPAPRLRRHRRASEAAARLLRHHGPARGRPPAHGSRHLLLERAPGHGRQRDDGLLQAAASRASCEVAARARSRGTPTTPMSRTIRGGKVTAPVVGGCLALLLQTMGTPWEIDVRRGDLLLRGLLRCRPTRRTPC